MVPRREGRREWVSPKTRSQICSACAVTALGFDSNAVRSLGSLASKKYSSGNSRGTMFGSVRLWVRRSVRASCQKPTTADMSQSRDISLANTPTPNNSRASTLSLSENPLTVLMRVRVIASAPSKAAALRAVSPSWFFCKGPLLSRANRKVIDETSPDLAHLWKTVSPLVS